MLLEVLERVRRPAGGVSHADSEEQFVSDKRLLVRTPAEKTVNKTKRQKRMKEKKKKA